MNMILVGIDGSEGSRRAATFARDLARAFASGLTLLHVIEQRPAGIFGPPEPPPLDHYSVQMHLARDFLSGLVEELDLVGAEPVIELGNPGDVICREAEERKADLIVLGRHGQRPGRRLLIGSVGAHVVAAASRSVTVVH